MQQIGGYTNTWDAEERLAASSINGVTTNYGYDGDGRRVSKQSGLSTPKIKDW